MCLQATTQEATKDKTNKKKGADFKLQHLEILAQITVLYSEVVINSVLTWLTPAYNLKVLKNLKSKQSPIGINR